MALNSSCLPKQVIVTQDWKSLLIISFAGGAIRVGGFPRHELRNTLAGKHVLKMYKQHRLPNNSNGEIVLNTVNQNRIPWMELIGSVSVLSAVSFGVFFSSSSSIPK